MIYRILLKLYPADFRARFQGEMLSAHEEAGGGFSELAGLIAGAAVEWIAKWTYSPAVRARWMADWRFMRPAGVDREEFWGGAPGDLIDAQRRVDFCVSRMMDAIANHKFEQARFYSNEDLKAREILRRVREKYAGRTFCGRDGRQEN
jgi:hypothetical protein